MLLFSEKFRPLFAPEGGDGAAAPADSAPSGSPGSAGPSDAAASPARLSEAGSEFQGFGGEYDDGDDTVTIPAEKVSAPAPVTPEAPPAAPAQAAKPPEQKPPEVPKAAPEPPVAQTPPPAAAAPAAKDDPEGLVGRLSEHREAIIDGLATQRFALTPQEVDSVTADPAAAVPRLLAKSLLRINPSFPAAYAEFRAEARHAVDA